MIVILSKGNERSPAAARLEFYVLQLKKESVHVVVEWMAKEDVTYGMWFM